MGSLLSHCRYLVYSDSRELDIFLEMMDRDSRNLLL